MNRDESMGRSVSADGSVVSGGRRLLGRVGGDGVSSALVAVGGRGTCVRDDVGLCPPLCSADCPDPGDAVTAADLVAALGCPVEGGRVPAHGPHGRCPGVTARASLAAMGAVMPDRVALHGGVVWAGDGSADESIRDVVSDDLVRRVHAGLDVGCDHEVCWVREVVEAVLPLVAGDPVLLARVRAVSGG